MCFGNRTQRTSNPPFCGEIQLSHWSLRKPWETQFSQCSPYVSLLLMCGRFADSSFQWISVLPVGILENSGIEMRILWTSLNQDGGVGFLDEIGEVRYALFHRWINLIWSYSLYCCLWWFGPRQKNRTSWLSFLMIYHGKPSGTREGTLPLQILTE